MGLEVCATGRTNLLARSFLQNRSCKVIGDFIRELELSFLSGLIL